MHVHVQVCMCMYTFRRLHVHTCISIDIYRSYTCTYTCIYCDYTDIDLFSGGPGSGRPLPPPGGSNSRPLPPTGGTTGSGRPLPPHGGNTSSSRPLPPPGGNSRPLPSAPGKDTVQYICTVHVSTLLIHNTVHTIYSTGIYIYIYMIHVAIDT